MKPSKRRPGGAWGLALGLALAGFGCQDGYPIPATHCDVWCEASRPFLCFNYDPAGCVLACQQRGGDAPTCENQFQTLISCLDRTRSTDPSCRSYSYENPKPLCPDEFIEFGTCSAPYARNGYGTLTL